jgi:hypothetical protein
VLKPPSSTPVPITNSVLLKTEPIIEALTTVVSPAARAKMPTISSAAFPRVAFSMPPIRGPV